MPSAPERRLQALLAGCADGLWCLELAEPVPTTLSPDEQVEMVWRTGQVVEASAAMARMCGLERADQLIGARAEHVTTRETLRHWVAGSHQWTGDHETLTGEREGDAVIRLWGIRRGHPDDQRAQARKMAAIARVVSKVTHDFNNVLGAIMVQTEALEYDITPDHELHPEIEFLKDAVRRSVTMNRQLSSVGKKRQFEPEPVDLGELLAKLEHELAQRAGPAVSIERRGGSGQLVLSDRAALAQLVTELVANAAAAMPGGGPIVVATAFRGATVVLTVADRGSGMDHVTRERMFEPFFTTRSDDGAAGLGLSAVYATVERSGGTIAIDSAPGHGTTVTICFPVWVAPGLAR